MCVTLQLVEQLRPDVSLYELELLQKWQHQVHVPETAPSAQEPGSRNKNNLVQMIYGIMVNLEDMLAYLAISPSRTNFTVTESNGQPH